MSQISEPDAEHSLETYSAIALPSGLEKPSSEELFSLSLGARVGIAMLDYGAA